MDINKDVSVGKITRWNVSVVLEGQPILHDEDLSDVIALVRNCL